MCSFFSSAGSTGNFTPLAIDCKPVFSSLIILPVANDITAASAFAFFCCGCYYDSERREIHLKRDATGKQTNTSNSEKHQFSLVRSVQWQVWLSDWIKAAESNSFSRGDVAAAAAVVAAKSFLPSLSSSSHYQNKHLYFTLPALSETMTMIKAPDKPGIKFLNDLTCLIKSFEGQKLEDIVDFLGFKIVGQFLT